MYFRITINLYCYFVGGSLYYCYNLFSKGGNMARPSKGKSESLMVRMTPEQKKDIRMEAAITGKDMGEIMLEGYALYKKKYAKK